MPESSADRDPLERLAEEFVTRYRSGQRPALTEYCGRHPELAEQIREVFPALVEMEQLKPVTTDRTSDFIPTIEPADPIRVGEFRILRAVGRGGMGVVYEAVQESLGRHVALKLLPAEALADPRRLERFRREAKAAARLHHTNIVPVFGTGEADGRHFYAMQFIDGHPLDAVIEEVRRLKDKSPSGRPERAVSGVAEALLTGAFVQSAPLAETPLPGSVASSSAVSSPVLSGSLSDGGRHYWEAVARIGAQAADALAYAHSQGIQHRDIKPANLLLDLRGTLWVTDFGLAKATDADDLTHAGDVVGTLRYLAPERFDGKGDERADLYALGLTLYELLTLKPAFTADTRAKLVEQVVAASPPRPGTVNPSVPRDLETVVLKATAREPALRYPTAGEMAEDLRRYLQDLPIRARRASSAEQAWRWCRRNPAVAALLTALLLVFAIGAGVASWLAVLAKGERDQAQAERNRANDEATRVRTEQERTRRLLYDSQLNQAAAAFAGERVPRLLQLLDEMTPKSAEPDLRGWEWHYLHNLTRLPIRHEFVIEGGSAGLQGLAFSPDGHWLTGQKPDGTGWRFEVWDVPSGKLVANLPKPGSPALPGLSSRLPPKAEAEVSADGQFFTVLVRSAPAKGQPGPSTFYLWRLNSGELLPAPVELPDNAGRVVIGPEAAWVGWAEVEPLVEQQIDGQTDSKGTVVTAARWERGTGKVIRKRCRSHSGTPNAPVTAVIARDCKTMTCVPGSAMDVTNLGVQDSDGWIESWDLTADPPRLRWQPVSLSRLSRLPGNLESVEDPFISLRLVSTRLSPGQTTLAVLGGQEEVDVYRLSDGKLQWRIPASDWSPATNVNLLGVSDDGNRVLLHSDSVFTILERSGNGDAAETRRICRHPASQNMGDPRRWATDGRNFFRMEQRRADWMVREIDLSSERGFVRALPQDSHRIEQLEILKPAAKKCVLRDAAGVELGSAEFPVGVNLDTAVLLADSRRVLVNAVWPSESIDDKSRPGTPGLKPAMVWWPRTWTLCELLPGTGLRKITTGKGVAQVTKGVPWFVVSNRLDPTGVPSLLTIHHLTTGECLRRISEPPGHELQFGEFSPTGDQCAVLSRTKPPQEGTQDGHPLPVGPKEQWISLRLIEMATGNDLWTAKIRENGLAGGQVMFSPDGRRICVVVSGSSNESSDVWVGNVADGTRERLLKANDPADNPSVTSGLSGMYTLLGFASDARLLLQFKDEVQIWNLDTGEKEQALAGHHEHIIWNRVSPNGDRLFVLSQSAQRPTKWLHVWDLRTGRQLLELLCDENNTHTPREVLVDGEKLYIPQAKGYRVFDGSPAKP